MRRKGFVTILAQTEAKCYSCSVKWEYVQFSGQLPLRLSLIYCEKKGRGDGVGEGGCSRVVVGLSWG